jgi:hypothetical protein
MVAVVVVAGLASYAVFVSSQRTSASTTNTTGSTNTSTNFSCTNYVTMTGHTQYCAAPLSYAAFQQFVNQSSSIVHQNGAIILTVGHNPCIIQYYALPNDTDVEIYLGPLSTTQTCE